MDLKRKASDQALVLSSKKQKSDLVPFSSTSSALVESVSFSKLILVRKTKISDYNTVNIFL